MEPFEGLDFYDIESLLTEEEIMIRDMVREWVDEEVLPKIEHACEMSAACTTCHCIVRKGFDALDEASDLEEDLLDKAWGLEQTSRLSCQAIPPDEEEIEIELPKYNINMVSEDH